MGLVGGGKETWPKKVRCLQSRTSWTKAWRCLSRKCPVQESCSELRGFSPPPPIIFTTPNFLDTCLLKLFSIGCGLCFGIVQFCLKLFLLFKKRKQISKIFYWIFHINKKKILHNFSFFILIPVFFKFVGCLGIGVFN